MCLFQAEFMRAKDGSPWGISCAENFMSADGIAVDVRVQVISGELEIKI